MGTKPLGASGDRIDSVSSVMDADGDQVAAPQLAVDGEIEQSQLSHLPLDLEPGPYGQIRFCCRKDSDTAWLIAMASTLADR